jgi:type II secretory pathway component PulJ
MRRNGFTLVELAISAVIILIIGLVLVVVFRFNITSWKWGQKHMEFQQKVQLAMKQIFTDIKRVNPIVSGDERGNLWYQGEKIGDLVPNLVRIYDKDKNPENGGEEIVFYHTTFKDLAQKTHVRLFLENGSLFRETTDPNGTKKRMVISNKASELHFVPNPADICEVGVRLMITDDLNPELKEDLNFAVHLDTDLVCVKMTSVD